MGALFSRVKTWVTTEDVTAADLNAEFDNILNNLVPLLLDDYSANATQMQVTADPGEVGTESLATTLAGELARLRFIIKEITGESKWYESPVASLIGLSNAIGTGLTANRLVSGRVLVGSQMPTFLVPNGAARTVTVKGATTSLSYYINGVQYSIAADVNLTGLTAAPSTNNTCLVNDSSASGQYWTRNQGEDGTEIPVDTMGSEISALVGKFAAFKLVGAGTEYFFGYVKSTTSISKAMRGYFFDSTDAPIVRTTYSNNDTITLMKLAWIFAKTDGTLTVAYTNPTWSADEPSSPSIGDYWFDMANSTWKYYSATSFVSADAVLIGVCFQDTTATLGARSYEFFANYGPTNTIELFFNSVTQVISRWPGTLINVWGASVKNEHGIFTWDMTLDRDTGVSESASTYYYFYVTETGDKVISDKKPFDRREDLQGYYHPHQSWRCVGRAFNNSSSDLTDVESYFRRYDTKEVRNEAATGLVELSDRRIFLSGASSTFYLPPAANCRGLSITFCHEGTSLTQIYTLDAFSTETITSPAGAATTFLMHTNGQVTELLSTGSGWKVLYNFSNNISASYTPTITGVGTAADVQFFWWREGKFINVIGAFTTGTTTATPLTITLPGSLTIDFTGLPEDYSYEMGTWYGQGTTTLVVTPVVTRGPYPVIMQSGSTGTVQLTTAVDTDQTGTAGRYWASENASAIWGNAQPGHVRFKVPIVGMQP